jgi:hypothetical protein
LSSKQVQYRDLTVESKIEFNFRLAINYKRKIIYMSNE